MIDRKATLALPGRVHARLRDHLFPGDGLEAAAVLICTRFGRRRLKLAVRETILVPYEQCEVRTPTRLTWPGEVLEHAISMAEANGDSIILLHSHPGGYFGFSSIDDDSDAITMPALEAAVDAVHGSAVMTPDGAIRARIYPEGVEEHIDLVSVAGDEISFFWRDAPPQLRPSLAFSGEMTAALRRLSAFVIGVSGTGSPTAEQLCRMGLGEVGLVDPDRVEHKNLNRILNSTEEDALERTLKVEMFAAAALRFAPRTLVCPYPLNVLDRETVLAASEADVIFCCVDSDEGRQICDLIASCFCIPLIDMGVQIPVHTLPSGRQRIAEVYGRVDYVQPGGPTLEDRGVYSPESLAAEELARSAPDEHQRRVAEGYMKGRAEEAPSVIALNMRASSMAVMEFIARAYPFRHDPNSGYARTLLSLAAAEEDRFSEDEFEMMDNPLLCSGAAEPLLGLPVLSKRSPT